MEHKGIKKLFAKNVMMNTIDRLLSRNSELYKFYFEKYQFFIKTEISKVQTFEVLGGWFLPLSFSHFRQTHLSGFIVQSCHLSLHDISLINSLHPFSHAQINFETWKQQIHVLEQINWRRSIREKIILHLILHRSKSYLRWKSLIESEVSFSGLTHHAKLVSVRHNSI